MFEALTDSRTGGFVFNWHGPNAPMPDLQRDRDQPRGRLPALPEVQRREMATAVTTDPLPRRAESSQGDGGTVQDREDIEA